MSSQSFEPIAIIGIACEFAGDVHSPDDLWEALVQSRDLGGDIPAERTDLVSYCAHLLNQDNGDFQNKLIRRGYFLSSSSYDMFEPSFFGLSDGEASTIDPCHRLLMIKVVHLLENAGYALEKIRGTRTSVHIGQFSNDASITSSQFELEHRTRYHTSNSLVYNASARLSYHFDLRGPNLTLDTACSSSLQAVHLAVQALRTGEANMSICGGVNSVYTPEQLYNSSIAGPVSSDGRSRAFSMDANGYAKAEGAGLVLLKRLSDAERDGDRIHCVLHDVLSNHDGFEGKAAFTVPSSSGQQRLLTDLYGRTQYDPQRIFYIEAHGTGTQVGDPIEANALGKFFSRSSLDPPLLLGSIKSNIGHTEGAAGIASLIKVAMCMKHKSVPPNMHLSVLNPKIEREKFNLHVVQNKVLFPCLSNSDNSPVAIGINSFGIGGSNAHAIVEEYRPKNSKLENGHKVENPLKQHFLFIFSAKTRESLHQLISLFNTWWQQWKHVDDERSFLACISRQLLLQRTISFDNLAILVGSDRTQLQQQIDAFLAETKSNGLLVVKRPMMANPRICFVFSGQGPQWWAMGRQLYESEPVYRQWIQRIDREFSKVNEDGWQLLNELIKKNESESCINDTNIAQPALFAVQVALAGLLVSWNIYPSAIVSHSAGEQAAAFVSGRLSLSEAVRVVYHRSRLQHRNTRQGGRMLAVAMSEQEARDLLLNDIEHLVTVAVVNSPRSVTLSGEAATIAELQQILSTLHPNIFKAQLRIENAFHSHQMDRFGVKEEMLSALGDISGLPLLEEKQMFDARCAQAHLYSSVTGGKMDNSKPVNAHHWWANVRQCVRFADAIEAIIRNEQIDAYLELSPHPVLATSIHECCEANGVSQPLVLSTLKRKEDEQSTLLTNIAQLSYSKNVWQSYLYSRCAKPDNDKMFLFDTFPLYPFNKTPCWYEPKECTVKRLANRFPVHPLLGVRQWTKQTCATWKSLINLKLPDFAYLQDHKVQDVILFPAAGFLELALAACRQLLSTGNENETETPISFERIQFLKGLPLVHDELIEVITQVAMPMHEWSVYSRQWSAIKKDCVRTAGMAGTDVIDSFVDPQSLNAYSLSEFTLHARGRIDIGPHLNIYATSALRMNDDLVHWKSVDSSQTYARLFTKGYQYGPQFQVMKSIKCTVRQAIGHIRQADEIQNDGRYYLNPIVFDGCLHTLLSILTSNEAYVPVSIDRLIVYGTTFSVPDVTAFTKYHRTVHGIPQENPFTGTLSVFDSRKNIMDSNTKPIYICEVLKIQRFLGSWSPLNKSIFEKVNEAVDLPNTDLTEFIKKVESDYCLKKTWSYKTIETQRCANTLLSPDRLLDEIHLLNNNSKEINDIDDQLNNSIESISLLAANYVVIALRYLAKVNNVEPFISDKLHQCVRVDQHHFVQLFDAAYSLVNNYNLTDACENTAVSTITTHSIQLMRKELVKQYPLLKPLLDLLHICGAQLGKILSGENDVGSLFENKANESILEDVYILFSSFKIHLALEAIRRQLQNHTPQEQIYVLIIGGGTYSVISSILNKLINISNETDTIFNVLCVEATVELVNEAKQTFQSILSTVDGNNSKVSISFEIYDIEDNSNATTILKEPYHIALAVNVLHTTSDVAYSLDSIRRLLRPGGLLLLVELTVAHLYLDLVFGVFPYWWRHNDGTRAPLTTDQWIEIVKSVNGFEEPPKITPMNAFGDSLIVLQKSVSPMILNQLPEREDQSWLILGDEKSKLGYLLKSHLPTSNVTLLDYNATYEDICSTIQTMLMEYTELHIVFAWPLDTPTIGDRDDDEIIFKWEVERLCNTFLGILKTLQEYHSKKQSCSYIYVLTQNAQPIGSKHVLNPYVSPLIGLVRSLTIEYVNHYIKLVDLQPSANDFCNSSMVVNLVDHMIDSRIANHLDEVVLCRDDKNLIQRFEWHYESIVKESLQKPLVSKETIIVPSRDSNKNPFRLQIAPSRLLNDLVWVKSPSVTETLLPDQVQVLVHCIGINFRDVLKARGLYPHTRAYAQLEKDYHFLDRDDCFGLDFMGTIHRSSSDLYKIGDRVIGASMRGVFHSHITVNTLQVVHVPNDCSWSDEQLSTLIIPFITALYSLKHRLHLRSGQTVLIHAATGATGQACIQYCQSIGARVIATAGSEQKRCFLREKYGIKHVFNSRDLSFVAGILAVVPGGVNCIVNSLSGPLLQGSVKLLAPHGHFVELGKRDIFANSSLSLFNLREDCSFHIIDLALLGVDEPDFFSEMIHDMMEYVQRGIFKPFEPIKIFEPSEVIEAFTQSSLGLAIGKSVIRIANSDKPLLLTDASCNTETRTCERNEHMFPSDVSHKGTVLISGGFGGLGLAMSRWMIEKHDVKHIALMSRRSRAQLEQLENNPELKDWHRLQQVAKDFNAEIDIIQADVTRYEQVYDLIKHLSETPYPVRSIIHSAVVSDDKLLANLDQKILARVMEPKIRGAWNLHRASQIVGIPLHFFVMFSSIRNHLIDLGSSGYNAGNEFLDALAYYRSQNLQQSTLSISLPGITGAGMFHRQRDILLNLYNAQGYETLPTYATFELIERLFARQKCCPAPIIFAIDWNNLSSNKDRLPNYQLVRMVEQHIDSMALSHQLAKKTHSECDLNIETITEQTRETVMRLLGSLSVDRIDINRSLLSQGMDSLAAVSLYNWISDKWSIQIPLANILQGISIQSIASQVHEKLGKSTVVDMTREADLSIEENNVIRGEDTSLATPNNFISGYKGIEGLVNVRFGKNGEPTVFCIFNGSIDPLFQEILQKSTLACTIYVIQAPMGLPSIEKCARETILLIRRLQPRGPYLLFPVDADAKIHVNEMLKQLEQYVKVGKCRIITKDFFTQTIC